MSFVLELGPPASLSHSCAPFGLVRKSRRCQKVGRVVWRCAHGMSPLHYTQFFILVKGRASDPTITTVRESQLQPRRQVGIQRDPGPLDTFSFFLSVHHLPQTTPTSRGPAQQCRPLPPASSLASRPGRSLTTRRRPRSGTLPMTSLPPRRCVTTHNPKCLAQLFPSTIWQMALAPKPAFTTDNCALGG